MTEHTAIDRPRTAQARRRSWLPLVAALHLGLLVAVPVHAGLFDDEEARKAILEIRSRLDRMDRVDAQTGQNQQQLSQQLQQLLQQQQQQLTDRKAEVADLLEQISVLKRANLELNNLIELLRADQAKLRGQDEQAVQGTRDIARDLAESQRRQKDLLATLAALDDRIKRLEPQKVTLDGREIQIDPNEKRAYDDAIAILRRGEFAKAADALQVYARRYPGGAYAGHVQYWLGNAQYGKGEVKEAAATFRALVVASPEHPRASEALLALANCQVELKDTKTARKTLEELVKAYPQSEAAATGRERLALLK